MIKEVQDEEAEADMHGVWMWYKNFLTKLKFFPLLLIKADYCMMTDWSTGRGNDYSID